MYNVRMHVCVCIRTYACVHVCVHMCQCVYVLCTTMYAILLEISLIATYAFALKLGTYLFGMCICVSIPMCY